MSRPAAKSRHPRLRSAVLNIGLVIASFMFTAVLAEIAIRIAAPQQLIVARPDLWQAADSVGWLRKPNINASVNTGAGSVRLIADQEGFRIGKRGRTAGVPVLFLGD